MDVSRVLTVLSHHEASYTHGGRRGQGPTVIVGGVVLTVQAFGGGLVLAGDLRRSHVHWPPIGH
jgi:hypothetical protein